MNFMLPHLIIRKCVKHDFLIKQYLTYQCNIIAMVTLRCIIVGVNVMNKIVVSIYTIRLDKICMWWGGGGNNYLVNTVFVTLSIE